MARLLAHAFALFAMAVLVYAVPVHHGHMLHLAMAAAEPETAGGHGKAADAGERHRGHHHHHHAVAGGDADALAAETAPSHEGDEHQMPRCPVCSTVAAGGLSIAAAPPPFILPVMPEPAFRVIARVAPPASHHFLPVQPRAPPKPA